MLKLIKLEWKKNNISKYALSAFILAAFLCLFLFALAFLGIAEDPDGTLDAVEGMKLDYYPNRRLVPFSSQAPMWVENPACGIYQELRQLPAP